MPKGIKNKKIEQTETQAVLLSVKSLNLDTVINDLGTLQLKIQSSLGNVTTDLTNKIKQLETVDEAIAIKESRLQELYGIENLAITLDEMKAQKEEEEKITLVRREERAKVWAEDESERQKQWLREKEEWDYKVSVEKKKQKDQLETDITLTLKNEATRKDLLEKTWSEREAVLKLKEIEFADMKKKVDSFDSRMKEEIAKAERIVTAVMKKDFDHQLQLIKKDCDTEKATGEIKSASYELTIKNLESQIIDFKTRLAVAQADAKDVATQALQSASEKRVADALQKVVEKQEATSKK